MLIRSQNKNTLVNFKNAFYVMTFREKENENFKIYTGNTGDECIVMGEYTTLEQARDILDEIEVFYADKNANRLIYTLPPDDGVIWEDRHGKTDA